MPVNLQQFQGLTPEQIVAQFTPQQIQEAAQQTGAAPQGLLGKIGSAFTSRMGETDDVQQEAFGAARNTALQKQQLLNAQVGRMGRMGTGGTSRATGSGGKPGQPVDVEDAFSMGDRVGGTGQATIDVPGRSQDAPFGGVHDVGIPEIRRLPVTEVDDANFQAGRGSGERKAILEAGQAGTDRERMIRKEEQDIATGQVGLEQQKFDLDQDRQEATEADREKILTSLDEAFAASIKANPHLTFDEFIETNTLPGQIGPDEAERSFNRASDKLAGELRSEENTFLYQRLQPRINADALVKNAGNLKFAMSSLVSGYNQQNGFGDIAMIIGAVRLSDPAVSVRAEDVKTIEQALALLEKYAPEMVKARMSEGDRLLPEGRKRLYFQTLDLYTSQQSQIDFTLEQIAKDANSALPFSGERIDNFLSSSRLPGVGEGAFGLLGRDTVALRDAVEFEKLRRQQRVK